jgi:excisionase family DNA binding protein
MAHTRTKPRKAASSVPANGLAPASAEIFTLPEAAAYLRVSESDLVRLVHDQALPGRQFGTEWRFLKSAIQDWLRIPPKTGSREAVLSAAGAWKNDAFVEAELDEIYRKRRENLVEDIQ